MKCIEQTVYLESANKTLDFDGTSVASHDSNHRIEAITQSLRSVRGIQFSKTRPMDEVEKNTLDLLVSKTHKSKYIDFLKSVSNTIENEILHHEFVCPHNLPDSYISKSSWPSAYSSIEAVYQGANLLQSDTRTAYVLNRPPGHHAGKEWLGGFCYLNNAALAAIYLRDTKNSNVGILDIDIHFGNGTEDIVSSHDELYYVSLHADRNKTFPFYKKEYDSKTSNRLFYFDFEQPPTIETYLDSLSRCDQFFRSKSCEYLVVSVGYDTAINDPLGGWSFQESDFHAIGKKIMSFSCKRLLLVQEGGYNMNLLSICARAFVQGLMGLEMDSGNNS